MKLCDFVLFGKTWRFTFLPYLLDIFRHFITQISTFPKLQISLIVLGYVFPTLLITCLTHSDLVFVLPKIFAFKEKLWASWFDKKIRAAEYLSTVATMMLSSVKRMKFFITFETIVDILVSNPFLFRTEWCFDYLSNLVIHFRVFINDLIWEKIFSKNINAKAEFYYMYKTKTDSESEIKRIFSTI